MSSYPWKHIPGEAAPVPSRSNPVPPLDEDGLGDVLHETAGFHSSVDQRRDGLRNAALSPLTFEQTKNNLAALAGFEHSIVAGIGYLVERLTHPITNPALAGLDAETAKKVQALGEQYRYELMEFGPHQIAADIAALLNEA
ncbi:hypothetical protein [Streptomyces sp. NPDC056191]|uniref:hypothetical protein n=1 Tax=Streptomyces sp. NPDC056191 TaxID=3345742 RepID=UPI0035D6E146